MMQINSSAVRIRRPDCNVLQAQPTSSNIKAKVGKNKGSAHDPKLIQAQMS